LWEYFCVSCRSNSIQFAIPPIVSKIFCALILEHVQPSLVFEENIYKERYSALIKIVWNVNWDTKILTLRVINIGQTAVKDNIILYLFGVHPVALLTYAV
jgi:hypothetical protein